MDRNIRSRLPATHKMCRETREDAADNGNAIAGPNPPYYQQRKTERKYFEK
jgi:hypothetical protein